MKIQIYNWAANRQVNTLLEAAGYQAGFYEVDNIYEIVEKLYYLGLNVMLLQPIEGVHVIAVDFKHRFSQR